MSLIFTLRMTTGDSGRLTSKTSDVLDKDECPLVAMREVAIAEGMTLNARAGPGRRMLPYGHVLTCRTA